MKEKIVVIFLTLFGVNFSSRAQDYFSDLSSPTTPIFLQSKGNALFAASINAGDNSVKAVFFKQYQIDNPKITLQTPEYRIHFWGWGLNSATKTTSGLGSLVSSGQFSPDFTGGGYLSYSIMHWEHADDPNKTLFSQLAFILSGTLSTGKYQLWEPSHPFATQLVDTNFNGRSLSLSVVKAIFPRSDNWYFGLSVTGSRKNNYDKLAKFEIKDDSSYMSTTGVTRNVQPVNDNGYTYAKGTYTEYSNFRVQANASFSPGALDHKFAFILYPSIDYSKTYTPIYNIGLSVAHLKDGLPSVSDAALYFQLNDMGNAVGKSGAFLKRSFALGVSTTFNIFTSK